MAKTSSSDDALRVASASRPSPTLDPNSRAILRSGSSKRKLGGPSKAQFDLIFKNGIVVHSRTLRMLGYPGTGLVGIAVAKKLGTHAVRNKLKRRCREALRACKSEISVDVDYVVVLGLPASLCSLPDLTESIRQALVTMKSRGVPKGPEVADGT